MMIGILAILWLHAVPSRPREFAEAPLACVSGR